MNELIRIAAHDLSGTTTPTCNARDLWAFVESKAQFADWIKGRIEKYGFTEGQDFTVQKFVNGRATVIDYHLTIDMAKELAMVENNDKGRQIRRYFIECERRAQAPAAPKARPSHTALDKLRTANALKLAEETAAKICAQFSSLGDNAKQVIYAKIINPIAGTEVVQLPSIETPHYTAAQVGERFGITAAMVGRIANQHHLKTPEYGAFFLDKSPHSPKHVETWRYNERGAIRIGELAGAAVTATVVMNQAMHGKVLPPSLF